MKWMRNSAIPLCLALATFALAPAAAWGGGDQGDQGGQGDQGNHGDHGNHGGGKPGMGNGNGNDFSLFDGSNPVNQPNSGAICGARLGRPFTFHLAVANYGSAGFVRVTYADGDFIQFPIAAQGSFSMSQAAGSRSGNDAVVRVSNGGSGAQLAGALSAEGGKCASCDVDGGIGDTGCDQFVPN